MSIEVMTAVWKHAPVQSGELLILLALADYADEDGGSFPAIETLAKKARMSGRNVQRCLAGLEEAQLIRIDKNGGPKGCNRYYVQVANLARKPAPETAAETGFDGAGDKLSPLTNPAQGVTQSTSGGDVGVTQTVKESIKESVSERESAGANAEDGDPVTGLPVKDGAELQPDAVVEAETIRGSGLTAFKAAHREWPTFTSDSSQAAQDAWFALEPAERVKAAEDAARYVAASRAEGRKLVCSFAVYLKEKRWEKLPERAAVSASAVQTIAYLPPFGPQWMALRFARLKRGARPLPPLTAIEADAVAQGGAHADFVTFKRHRAAFPDVGRMDSQAGLASGVTVPAEMAAQLAEAGGALVPVPVGSATWEAWRAAFEALGWPWLPDMGRHPTAYFPACEPEQFEIREQGRAA